MKNKIICGDALEEMKKLPSESVDMIMTSPPYWALEKFIYNKVLYKIMNRDKLGRFKKGYTYRNKKPFWNKEWLYNEYINKQKSAKEIADIQKCHRNTIYNWL